MRRFLPTAILLLIAQASSAEKPSVCKTTAIASSCYQTHGRLAVYNGTPSWRLWEIGTTHLLAIFSGPAGFACDRYQTCSHGANPGDNEDPRLPSNVRQPFFSVKSPIYEIGGVFADFEVRPLERHIPGHMQAACIESAKHIFVQK